MGAKYDALMASKGKTPRVRKPYTPPAKPFAGFMSIPTASTATSNVPMGPGMGHATYGVPAPLTGQLPIPAAANGGPVKKYHKLADGGRTYTEEEMNRGLHRADTQGPAFGGVFDRLFARKSDTSKNDEPGMHEKEPGWDAPSKSDNDGDEAPALTKNDLERDTRSAPASAPAKPRKSKPAVKKAAAPAATPAPAPAKAGVDAIPTDGIKAPKSDGSNGSLTLGKSTTVDDQRKGEQMARNWYESEKARIRGKRNDDIAQDAQSRRMRNDSGNRPGVATSVDELASVKLAKKANGGPVNRSKYAK